MRKANVFAGYFPQSNGINKRGREEAKCLTAVGNGWAKDQGGQASHSLCNLGQVTCLP